MRGGSEHAAHGKGSRPLCVAKLWQEVAGSLDALVPHELETGAPMLSPAPIPPEERLIPNHERMQEYTHWRGFAVALPCH
jgi:hypothetical protein